MGLSHETITVGSFYTVNHCAKYSRTAAARGFLETIPPQGFASPEFIRCSFAELNSKRSIAGCSSSDVATDKMWHYFPFVSHMSFGEKMVKIPKRNMWWCLRVRTWVSGVAKMLGSTLHIQRNVFPWFSLWMCAHAPIVWMSEGRSASTVWVLALELRLSG